MGMYRSTYIGPYVKATVKPIMSTYENLVCPNQKCKFYKNPKETQKIDHIFCNKCGSKMEMKSFTKSHNKSYGHFLDDAEIEDDRLLEINHEWISIKQNEKIFITNITFQYSTYYDRDAIAIDFTKNNVPDTAILEFKKLFAKELEIIEQNFTNIEYGYGLVIWYS